MEKRFGALRFIGSFYKILGIIIGVLTIITAISICAVSVLGGTAMQDFSRNFGDGPGGLGVLGGALGGLLFGVIALLNGGILAVGLYAIGEGIYLLLALEANTRQTVKLLQEESQ